MDDIIDLGDYVRRRDEADKPPKTAFTVWGGEGEKGRFALPLWRFVYLAGGTRGGLVWTANGEDATGLHPFVVLDLAEDPARIVFPAALVRGLEEKDAPSVRDRAAGGITVFVGEHDGRRWYLVVDECDPKVETLEGRTRDDILFLAGECAGLLFFRGFAGEAGKAGKDEEV